MKIIEALKQVKDLKRKADDLKTLVKDNCTLSSLDTPKYPEQAKQIKGWIQAHSDILKEICRLRVAIQKTNILTDVTIELDGKQVKKNIASWIHRRRDLAKEELEIWTGLTDRGIKEGVGKTPSGEAFDLKVVRFWEPAERDKMRSSLSSEPTLIDSKLEIINAVTDLIEG